MSDMNDAFFEVIKKTTGDDIRPEIESSSDNDLLKAMLTFLTVMLKKVTTEGADETQPVTSVTPFVS